jgi:hypothetical protein
LILTPQKQQQQKQAAGWVWLVDLSMPMSGFAEIS